MFDRLGSAFSLIQYRSQFRIKVAGKKIPPQVSCRGKTIPRLVRLESRKWTHCPNNWSGAKLAFIQTAGDSAVITLHECPGFDRFKPFMESGESACALVCHPKEHCCHTFFEMIESEI